MDIATLLEAHRAYMLEYINGTGAPPEWAHDRATAKVALDLHRSGGARESAPAPKRNGSTPGPKPGSKAARERAQKAAATRARNRANTEHAQQEAESSAGGA